MALQSAMVVHLRTMPHHDLAYAAAAGMRTGSILYRQDESARFPAIGVPARDGGLARAVTL
jgi:hypothetical protein